MSGCSKSKSFRTLCEFCCMTISSGHLSGYWAQLEENLTLPGHQYTRRACRASSGLRYQVRSKKHAPRPQKPYSRSPILPPQQPATPKSSKPATRHRYEKLSKLFASALESITQLSDKDCKAVTNLVRMCAKTWMECCSPPYRLLVSLPDGSGDLLAQIPLDRQALALVVRPELKRYGDSRGGNRIRGEVVVAY
jgi:hypothetical protein